MEYTYDNLKVGDIVLLHISEVNPSLKDGWYLYLGKHDVNNCYIFLDGELQVRTDGYLQTTGAHSEIIRGVR